jgi:hypothetical protein
MQFLETNSRSRVQIQFASLSAWACASGATECSASLLAPESSAPVAKTGLPLAGLTVACLWTLAPNSPRLAKPERHGGVRTRDIVDAKLPPVELAERNPLIAVLAHRKIHSSSIDESGFWEFSTPTDYHEL